MVQSLVVVPHQPAFEPRSALVSHLGAEVCACVAVCVNLGMTRSEISETVSSALSPVSVGAKKSYMTLSAPGCFKKKNKKYSLLNLKIYN